MQPKTAMGKRRIYAIDVFIAPDEKGDLGFSVSLEASQAWLELLAEEGGRSLAAAAQKKILPSIGKAFTKSHSKLPKKGVSQS
ncbi:hypothetical protein COW36_09195 [bacterium (Candidatus Blackallbacteria) CG17_big_fil_post_rev_8_21_14_2_50_48_46]|uniref:Uncharacterized protein n=1 Tax=bacterium (Candidatus Blackallbacteria) CG17_big_fil_post_rev_8_21_14_2_50_48_46 TaxID=2014261 RepID=A0A2M7G5R9_9BACT|nr:MAG: hypothetical protein COW64_23855 [bacterium (Candidatus Blackallbacteria) CG18_big_fil_WC_8_21_14_2_50_49_26]PIW17341.1 MAG: hypothetical protein COW36_09195 [bacterium (Candidatus Blackallbacteria) CG17_big_fil_post_rev_8_21_14_2_50_48_46]PIW47427.1 MAG: hypothetical protein COW20_12635 [bacterium (Candidatus Blackallbacteria) CG13_big_fil_rev_8_21_14_2_50_49_14]